MGENTLKIYTDKNNWDSILEKIGSYDFYHSFDYHQLSKKDGENPLLLALDKGTDIIALPLLSRTIPGTDLFDATSVYGYAGPVSTTDPEAASLVEFQSLIKNYLASEGIISVFSRLNPYIPNQEQLLDSLGQVTNIGKVVNIDLTLPLEEQRSAYRRDTRSRVNKARRLLNVRRAETSEDIQIFIDIYLETMEKLNADDAYFFERDYFLKFLECDGFKTDILLAIDNETGDVAAGSMFVKTNNIIQYHLSGTKSEFFKIAPARLLLDEMRLEGTEEGYTYFNLGGGYQSQEDALFDFKSSFSGDHHEFKVWRFIVDQEQYDKLASDAQIEETSFFPAYRAPKPTTI